MKALKTTDGGFILPAHIQHIYNKAQYNMATEKTTDSVVAVVGGIDYILDTDLSCDEIVQQIENIFEKSENVAETTLPVNTKNGKARGTK